MARTIDTLDSLMGRILDLDARKLDMVADTRTMSSHVNGGGKLRLNVDAPTGVETFALNPHMRAQMAVDLGIPKRYWDRMTDAAPELLERNVNHWLTEEPKRRMVRAYREDAGNVGRAWMSDKYKRLDNIEVAKRLLPEFDKLGTDVEFHQAAITDTKLYIRATFPKIEAAIKVGDIVRWGVELVNSEVGSSALAIRGFVLRLVCTNGMVATDVLRARHVGKRVEEDGIYAQETVQADDNAFWLTARDMLRAAISETRFQEIVSQLQETTTGETIERPIKACEVLGQRYSLSDTEKETLLTKLVAGADLSKWGALNALTATAKTVESFDRQVELETAGYDLALAPVKEWSRIAVAA
jgi:hypothetical protein